MSEEREMLSARVPSELKRLVDADQRSNQEVMEAALWREFGGQRKGAVERRIEEKERRLSMVTSERKERKREEEKIKEKIAALKEKKRAIEENNAEHREEKLRKLKKVPNDPEHTFVQEVADELGIGPEQAIEESDNL